MKCIDLYSGIGGWTLGMKLNDIDHVRSFEWNEDSNLTHNNNFGTKTKEIDIRNLDFDTLPKPGTIDFVVGSPPCTQFSYANKGGNGDIQDGLIDMYKFLEVVSYLKPKYWAMENVPRVKKILEKVLNEDVKFKKFKKLFNYIEVVDCSEYGTPQKRKRMIAGNFPFELFENYKKQCDKITLGDVLASLEQELVKDPVYGYELPKEKIQDHILEQPLTEEELRLNRESKTYHPIYNKMSFPEDINRPSRTITSTCTRVSRESLIVKSNSGYRRLSVRERGMLMGFPITYQFYGRNYGAKLKMIGNAIPPVVTYYLFQAMKNVQPEDLIKIKDVKEYIHMTPEEPIPYTEPDTIKFKYRETRTFRLAIPGFRFGSGVRFELSNSFINKKVDWSVKFYYGSSKKFFNVELDELMFNKIMDSISVKANLDHDISEIVDIARQIDPVELQEVWSHQTTEGEIHPYEVLNNLGEIGKRIRSKLNGVSLSDEQLENIIGQGLNQKLFEMQSTVIAGILLGYAFNSNITEVKEVHLFAS